MKNSASNKKVTKPTNLRHYHNQRGCAHFEFRWENCKSGKCRTLQRCTGGKRGAFSKFGVPLCLRDQPALAARGHID